MKQVKLLYFFGGNRCIELTFDTQEEFKGFNWYNLKKGDPVYVDGEIVGTFYKEDEENVYINSNETE